LSAKLYVTRAFAGRAPIRERRHVDIEQRSKFVLSHKFGHGYLHSEAAPKLRIRELKVLLMGKSGTPRATKTQGS
jgi:hypothetical protein